MGLKARRAAEVAERRRTDAEAEKRKHLLVRMEADRNVREAYLYGVVFAGLANDDETPEVQSEERAILNGICESLALEPALVDEIIVAEKASIDGNEDKNLLCECLAMFNDIKVYDLFLEDFDKVWIEGKGKPSELKDWHNDFEKMVSPDVAKGLAERKSVAKRKAKEENAKRAAAEKVRQKKLEAERKKKAVEDQYRQLRDFVQDWISTKRVTQDVLITAKGQLKERCSSVDATTIFRETCKRLIERVVELDRKGGELAGGMFMSKRRPKDDKAVAEKIALETTWIVICLVLLKCKVSDLKMKTVNELLDYARHEDFSCDYSIDYFWRNLGGLCACQPRVEDFFVKASELDRVWDEVSAEQLSMTEAQKQQLQEWRSERKRYKREAAEAFARSIGVNRFMLYHEMEASRRLSSLVVYSLRRC